MSQILIEVCHSEFMINSTYWPSNHLVQSFSVVFLYWFYYINYNLVPAYCLQIHFLDLQFRDFVTVFPWIPPVVQRRRHQTYGSDEYLQRLMDQKKRKRMVSNRESARRSRMRRQKHLDGLMTHLSQLRRENSLVVAKVSTTMQHYTSLETENSVLKAQVAELSHRLESLNQIMKQPSYGSWGIWEEQYGVGGTELIDEFMDNSLSCFYLNQPVLATVSDMFLY
ncbi:hypothetical protein LXL04_017506 [Taraxacum kok-saghyz]